MLLMWSENYSKPNRLNCQVQVTVVQLANTEWFFRLPLQATEIEVKDPNFFIETFLSPFKHCILTFEFKAWMKNCNHDPSLFGGEAKDFCWTKLYNLCKYTREKEMLANNNWGEIWSHVLIRALQILETGPRNLEESWLLLTGKNILMQGSCIGLPHSRFSACWKNMMMKEKWSKLQDIWKESIFQGKGGDDTKRILNILQITEIFLLILCKTAEMYACRKPKYSFCLRWYLPIIQIIIKGLTGYVSTLKAALPFRGT